MAPSGKKTKLKEPVKVRTKKLADGSESYYLDIYVDGKRRYEFLKLYRLPEINAHVKEQNTCLRCDEEDHNPYFSSTLRPGNEMVTGTWQCS